MQPLTLINGSATRTLASSDRGFNFGQGVSTRIKVVAGKAQLWRFHMQALQQGCAALGFPINAVDKLVKRDLGILPKADLSLRVTLTAGVGSNSAATPVEYQPTRVLQIEPDNFVEPPVEGVDLWLCATPLSIHPRLAGIKHLNRLEQVLARSEWRDPHIREGVMFDTQGYVIGATASNIFWVQSGEVYTPDLSQAGVAGVMRAALLERARQLGIEVHSVRARLADLEAADELFLTNAFDGVMAVKACVQKQYAVGSGTLTQKLRTELAQVLYD